MTHPRALLRATALCATLASLPAGPGAMADITPEGLWQAWQDRAAATDHDLSASVVQDGTLTLDGLTITRALGTGTVTLGFDRLDLAQDGAAVRMTLQAGSTVTVTAIPGADDPDGETVAAVFALGDTPLTATAAGDAADPDWSVAADRVTLTLVSLTEDGTPVDADLRLDLGGLAGRLTGLGGAARPLSADMTVARLAAELAATDPDSGDTMRVTTTQSDTTLRADLTEDPADPDAWTLTASLAGGAASSVTVQSGPAGTIESDSRQDSGRVELTMTDTRSDYDMQINGMAIMASGSLVPDGPIGAAVDGASIALSVPTGPSPDLQTARLGIDLDGVMPDDRLWALIDPMAAVPRTPAAATLRAEADLTSFDPDAAGIAAPGPTLPALLPRALRITDVAVDLGTAGMAGDGAFDIPAGPMGIPAFQQATGTFDLRAVGLNGLLQRAMATGALSMEQAMGAQMMLGMFAVQGDGDRFSTRIELLTGGGLSVNGTRLR